MSDDVDQTIKVAKGVFMHVHRVDADRAGEMLKSRSRATGIEICLVANEVIAHPASALRF